MAFAFPSFKIEIAGARGALARGRSRSPARMGNPAISEHRGNRRAANHGQHV